MQYQKKKEQEKSRIDAINSKIQEHIEMQSSFSQMFFKTGVLKHFAVFTGKHLCQLEVLQLYLKETTTMVFSCEYCTIFKHSPFYKTPLVDLILINAMKPERTHDKTKLQGINGIQQKPFTGVLQKKSSEKLSYEHLLQ